MSAQPDRVVVVIGDIVGSSKYGAEDRRMIQRRLEQSVDDARRLLHREHPLHFRVVAGDEFELIGVDFSAMLRTVLLMRLDLLALGRKPPVLFRAVIAIGERYVVGGDDPYSHDGPAFRAARENIIELKSRDPRWLSRRAKQDLKTNWSHLTTLAAADSRLNPVLYRANHFLPALDTIYEGWSAEQAEAIRGVLLGQTLQDVAEELDAYKSSISQRLDRSHYEAYMLGIYGLEDTILTIGS